MVANAADATAPHVVVAGPLRIDMLARSAALAGAELSLTALQFDLLLIFVQSSGRLLAFEDVLSQLARLQTGSRDPSVVRYHVARLRARLGSYAGLIENVRGCGYRMRLLSTAFSTPNDE